jgi:hypothetical protein
MKQLKPELDVIKEPQLDFLHYPKTINKTKTEEKGILNVLFQVVAEWI